ncbi:hypothetical protein [Pedobacter sp. L105]|uniref:hypothetical protein n=1 Tax=Pedobacter sp. L105 TaxID=1641871 RepID=UPI00131A6C55|nr:hypothetical protein [Pedobacter sp. L105]
MKPAKKLAEWVALKHNGQLIRKTKKPYFEHLAAVAKWSKAAVTWGYEIGLCHDLLEDTATTQGELLEALISLGYLESEANFITSCVVELTDVFTAAAYPDLSKVERKKRESARLLTISPAAQTVKYADLIYNIDWMLKHDQKHAKKYLLKKQMLLAELTDGDEKLRGKALKAIHHALHHLKDH